MVITSSPCYFIVTCTSTYDELCELSESTMLLWMLWVRSTTITEKNNSSYKCVIIVIMFGKSQMKTDSDYCEFRSFKKVNNLYLREIGLKNFRKQTKRKTRFFFYGSYTTYNDNNYCCWRCCIRDPHYYRLNLSGILKLTAAGLFEHRNCLEKNK